MDESASESLAEEKKELLSTKASEGWEQISSDEDDEIYPPTTSDGDKKTDISSNKEIIIEPSSKHVKNEAQKGTGKDLGESQKVMSEAEGGPFVDVKGGGLDVSVISDKDNVHPSMKNNKEDAKRVAEVVKDDEMKQESQIVRVSETLGIIEDKALNVEVEETSGVEEKETSCLNVEKETGIGIKRRDDDTSIGAEDKSSSDVVGEKEESNKSEDNVAVVSECLPLQHEDLGSKNQKMVEEVEKDLVEDGGTDKLEDKEVEKIDEGVLLEDNLKPEEEDEGMDEDLLLRDDTSQQDENELGESNLDEEEADEMLMETDDGWQNDDMMDSGGQKDHHVEDEFVAMETEEEEHNLVIGKEGSVASSVKKESRMDFTSEVLDGEDGKELRAGQEVPDEDKGKDKAGQGGSKEMITRDSVEVADDGTTGGTIQDKDVKLDAKSDICGADKLMSGQTEKGNVKLPSKEVLDAMEVNEGVDAEKKTEGVDNTKKEASSEETNILDEVKEIEDSVQMSKDISKEEVVSKDTAGIEQRKEEVTPLEKNLSTKVEKRMELEEDLGKKEDKDKGNEASVSVTDLRKDQENDGSNVINETDLKIDEEGDLSSNDKKDDMEDEEMAVIPVMDTEKVPNKDAEKVPNEDAEKMPDDAEKVPDEDAEKVLDEDAEKVPDEDAEKVPDGDAEKVLDEDAKKVPGEDAAKVPDEDNNKDNGNLKESFVSLGQVIEKTIVDEPKEDLDSSEGVEILKKDNEITFKFKDYERKGTGAAGDNSDVIDMIEERTVSPMLSSSTEEMVKEIPKVPETGKREEVIEKIEAALAKMSKPLAKESEEVPDLFIIDDSNEVTNKMEVDAKPKEVTPHGEKKKSISSVLSRLQSKAVADTNQESLSAMIPMISQVKSLAKEPSKGQQVNNSVSAGQVTHKCTSCGSRFLAISPIKINDQIVCSERCLKIEQEKGITTICSFCHTAFARNSIQSRVVAYGPDCRLFCSQVCADDYAKRAKTCANCKRDVTLSTTSIIAQVEEKFQEFCTQSCVDAYEKKLKKIAIEKKMEASKVQTPKKVCSVCAKLMPIIHEVKFHGSLYRMCSAECFAKFRQQNNLSLRTCNQCSTTCYNEQSSNDEKDLHKVFFCSQKCLETFKQPSTLTEPCFSCKKMYKPDALTEERLLTGKVVKFCSQECKRSIVPSVNAQPVGAKLVTPQIVSGVTTTIRQQQQHVVPSTVPLQTTQRPVLRQLQQQKVSTEPIVAAADASSTPKTAQCNHCKKTQRPLYHLTMSDGSLRNFCCYPCVIAFQAQFNVPPVTLPQETLLLKCGQCKRSFSHRPQTLDYKGDTRLFCGQQCLDDFKRTESVVVVCDCCFEEKILYEETNFLGKQKFFCSPGCSLIFKNQYVKLIGLRCAMCDYCATICKVANEKIIGGAKKRFCGNECKENYTQWYTKMARCEGCKRMGCELKESFRWRGKVKRVCSEQCLLLFYTQQNVPDMTTQLQTDIGSQTNQMESSIPTITNVKSLASNMKDDKSKVSSTSQNYVQVAHKQTQITTNTIFVKPPPPPPAPLPPAPKMVKNKITLCKPYALTKSIMCKPITQEKDSQTDFQLILVPVPFPVYIPVPMQMYTTPVPHPFPIPIPVPTPMFMPVAYDKADELLQCLEEVKSRIPTDPFEADILMMADAIASKSENVKKEDIEEDILLEDGNERKEKVVTKEDSSDDGADNSDINGQLAPEDEDTLLEDNSDIADVPSENLESLDENESYSEDQRVTRRSRRSTRSSSSEGPSTSRPQRAKKRGAKRARLDVSDSEEEEAAVEEDVPEKEDVRPDIGPAAYSFFVQQASANNEADKVRLKLDLTEAGIDDLHYCLCRFVKEARQPNGEKYSGDTLYLILLSIQKNLLENDKKENIFMDNFFQTFNLLLHKELEESAPLFDPLSELQVSSVVDEEFLWESKQLGAHSPHILLNTIMYFATKNFMLYSLEMHKEMTFSRVQRLVRKDNSKQKSSYIRFLPPEGIAGIGKKEPMKGKKRPYEIDYTLEQYPNDDPARCPIKLHDFYHSKCPEKVRTSTDRFYLVPELACMPDSPLWYTSKPLPDSEIEKILRRHLMVKDVHEHWSKIRDEEEEEEEEDEDEEWVE